MEVKQEKNTDFIARRLAHINGLKSPSAQQQLFKLLADNVTTKGAITPEEKRKFGIVFRAEQALEKSEKLNAAASKMLRKEKTKASVEERKARNHQLILLGTLFDAAGLMDKDRGSLFGALLALKAEMSRDQWHGFKQKGDAALAKIEADKASKKQPG